MSRSRVKGFGWLFLLFLSGNFLVSNAYAETDVIKDILKRGELRVAVQSQGPPMSFIDKKGQRAGFVIDVISMMAQDMSVELKILDYDWKGLIPAVLSKKADFLAADMTPTPKRALVLNFTDPYTFVDIVLYSKTSAPFKKWQDVCERKFTVGVVQGSSNVGVLRKKCGAAKIKEFSGGAAAVAESKTGESPAAESRDAAPGTPEPDSFRETAAKIKNEELLAKVDARLERERRLLPRAKVETAFANCGRTIRGKIELIETWADDLAGVCGGDATALRVRMRELLRDFQTDLAAALAALPTEDADDADDEHGGTDAENRAA